MLKWYVGCLVAIVTLSLIIAKESRGNETVHTEGEGVSEPETQLRPADPYSKVFSGELSNINQVVKIGVGCSSTLVSSNVILTAAHCISGTVQTVGATFIDGTNRRITCTKSDGAIANPPGRGMTDAIIRNDLAMCKLDRPVSVKPACVGRPKDSGSILYIGYGTTGVNGKPHYDGRQRKGRSRISQRRNGIINTFTNNLHGGPGANNAGIGSGDSGGFTGEEESDGQLWISGVNSASSAATSANPNGPYASGSSVDLSSGISQTAMKEWAQENGVKICGVNAPLSDFNGSPNPNPPSPNATPTPRPTSTPNPLPNPDDKRKNYRLDMSLVSDEAAVAVDNVQPGSIADTVLKLKAGDQILSVNGKAVKSDAELRAAVKAMLNGSDPTATLVVKRKDGKTETLTTPLPPVQAGSRVGFKFGFYPKDTGGKVSVYSVVPSGNAARAGIKAGEFITKVNRGAVSDPADAVKKIREGIDNKSQPTLYLTVESADGTSREVKFTLP